MWNLLVWCSYLSQDLLILGVSESALAWVVDWAAGIGFLSLMYTFFFTHSGAHCVPRALQGEGGRLGDSQTILQAFLHLLFPYHNWAIMCPISYFWGACTLANEPTNSKEKSFEGSVTFISDYSWPTLFVFQCLSVGIMIMLGSIIVGELFKKLKKMTLGNILHKFSRSNHLWELTLMVVFKIAEHHVDRAFFAWWKSSCVHLEGFIWLLHGIYS